MSIIARHHPHTLTGFQNAIKQAADQLCPYGQRGSSNEDPFTIIAQKYSRTREGWADAIEEAVITLNLDPYEAAVELHSYFF